jgi:hypothetical protein
VINNQKLEKEEIQEIEKAGYLSTEHINAANNLLRTEFPEICCFHNGVKIFPPSLKTFFFIPLTIKKKIFIVGSEFSSWICDYYYKKTTFLLLHCRLN